MEAWILIGHILINEIFLSNSSLTEYLTSFPASALYWINSAVYRDSRLLGVITACAIDSGARRL